VAAKNGISDAVLLRLIEKAAREWNNHTNPDAMTIEQFCARHQISRATLYQMMDTNDGPDTMSVRGRVLISREAAQRWRESREKAEKTHKRGRVAASAEATGS
jgi:hypothetical protein